MDKVNRIKRPYLTIPENNSSFKIGKNVAFVVANSLCTGCGTCTAICPIDAITMVYNEKCGIFEACINPDCNFCGICVQVCPGFSLDREVIPDSHAYVQNHPRIGPWISIWRSWSRINEIRVGGASGGIVTQIIAYLMETGRIDGAIVTRMDPNDPLRSQVYIARDLNSLLLSQKSKYCPSPLNCILKQFVQGDIQGQKFAYVGLPHHVHGLRYLEKILPHLKGVFPYVLSLFTSHVPSQHATEFLLYANGLNIKDVIEVEYRGRGVPGSAKIKMKTGEEVLIPHLDWSYWGYSFAKYFYPVREFLYFDKLSQWADFSVGDNWQQGFTEQNGLSTIIARTEDADKLLKEIIGAGLVSANEISPDELIKDQDLDRKLDIGIRLKVWDFLGRKVPFYDPPLPVNSQSFLKTLVFSFRVLLSERKKPFVIFRWIIYFDYLFNKRFLPKIRYILKLINLGISSLIPVKKSKYSYPYAKGRKILMIGGFGGKDIGDEAMPHADYISLENLSTQKLEIIMVSPDPEYTTSFHGKCSIMDLAVLGINPSGAFIEHIKTFFATILIFLGALAEKRGIRLKLWDKGRKFLDELVTCDLLFNVGGGNLNSIIPQELYKKCTMYLLADILGKPVFISGQTIGPFTKWVDRKYAKFSLSKVRMISFRDKEISQIRLDSIGVTQPQMFDAADDAISLPTIPAHEAIDILYKETGIDRRQNEGFIVAMNLKGSLKMFKGQERSSTLDQEINLMAKIADQLIEQKDAIIVFIPTDYNPSVDDRVLHRAIVRKMIHGEKAYCIEGEFRDTQLKGLIGLSDFAIGARYHFSVFAASMYVPFLGIASGVYQMTKLQGLADLCGLPQCFMNADMEYVEFNDIWERLGELLEQHTQIQEKLKEVIPFLEDKSKTVVKSAVAYLMETN